jgi:uncharacterized protein YndB with AHSA1/START domain
MPEAENETTIARPVEDVYQFLANAENGAQWRSSVVEISKVSGNGVGTQYKQSLKGPTGRPADADFEITELEPNRVIGFRTTSGPVRPVGRYELSPEGAGTRVRFSLKAELSGLKKAASPIVSKAIAKEVGELDNLKRVLEGGTAQMS